MFQELEPSLHSECEMYAEDSGNELDCDDAEFDSEYGPGKLHPVHLGDLFHDSRYKVLRKLGKGSFSTVWLARDRKYALHSERHPGSSL